MLSILKRPETFKPSREEERKWKSKNTVSYQMQETTKRGVDF